MAAIEREDCERESPAGFFQTRRAFILSAAATLLISAVLFRAAFFPRHPEVNEPVAAAVQKTTDRIFQNLPIAQSKSLQDWEKNLDQPLEQEIRRTMADARTAIDSLADSFLPEKLRKSLLIANQD